MYFMSFNGIVVLVKAVADLAAMSAFSLPTVLIIDGIQHSKILYPWYKSSFKMRNTERIKNEADANCQINFYIYIY